MKKINGIIVLVMLVSVLLTGLAGCAVSNKKLIEDINAEITGDNVLDATMGSYTLPTISAKQAAKSQLNVTYSVTDYFGNTIDSTGGKFNIAAGGEYTVNVKVTNKGGTVLVEKAIRITENSGLSHKLSDADIAEVTATRDKVLTDIFADWGINYEGYKKLSYIERQHVTDSGILDLIANLLNNGLLKSGISKGMLLTIFNNVSALFDAVDNAASKAEVVPKLLKDLFDKALAPIFSGAESSLVLAGIVYEQYKYTRQADVNKAQTEYDVYDSTRKAAIAVNAMTDEKLTASIKAIKTSAESKIAELAIYEKNNSEADYVVKLYNMIAESGALPTLSKAQLEKVFLRDNAISRRLTGMKASATNTEKLFRILAGAEMYKNKEFTALLMNIYDYGFFGNKATYDVFTSEGLPKKFIDNLDIALYCLQDLPNRYMLNLQTSDDANMPNIITMFKAKAMNYISDQVEKEIRADLDSAQGTVSEIIDNKVTVIESLTIAVKLGEIVSPIVNSNIAKELIIYAACDALGIEYSTDYLDKDNDMYKYNTADLSAILTSVSDKIDKFTAKYAVALKTLDSNIMKAAGYYAADAVNLLASEDMVESKVLTSIFTKHFTVADPLLSTIKQLITMTNTVEAIDFFAQAASPKLNTAEQNYLLTVNQYLVQSISIVNLIDASKGKLTIDEYIASIKADLMADKAFANIVGELDIDEYISKIKQFYTLSVDTLAATGKSFIIVMPQDEAAFKLVHDALAARWTELMKIKKMA